MRLRLALLSLLLSHPCPRAACRHRAARRQHHHGRQGLAASRRRLPSATGASSRSASDAQMAAHIGPNTQVIELARQDRGAGPDRHASASTVPRPERPAGATARREVGRGRAEGGRRARRAHRGRQVGDGLDGLAREHPGRRPHADAARTRSGVAEQSGVHPARRPCRHGELEGAGACRHHEGYAEPRGRHHRARREGRGDRHAVAECRQPRAPHSAAAARQHGRSCSSPRCAISTPTALSAWSSRA